MIVADVASPAPPDQRRRDADRPQTQTPVCTETVSAQPVWPRLAPIRATTAAVSSVSSPAGPPSASAGRSPAGRAAPRRRGAPVAPAISASVGCALRHHGPRRGLEPQQDGRLGRAALGAQARAQAEVAGADEHDLGPRGVTSRGDGGVRGRRVGRGDGCDERVEKARGRGQRHRGRDELRDADERAVGAGQARPGERHGERQRALQPLERRGHAAQHAGARAVDRGEDDERDLARVPCRGDHVLRGPGAPQRAAARARARRRPRAPPRRRSARRADGRR